MDAEHLDMQPDIRLDGNDTVLLQIHPFVRRRIACQAK